MLAVLVGLPAAAPRDAAAANPPAAGIQDGPGPVVPAPIARILQHPSLQGARVGMLVQELSDGPVLVDHGADEQLAPASVTKLFTAAAALWRLGPAHTWETPIAYRGRMSEGTLTGDLWVLGRGAPDIVEEKLWLAARALKDTGLDRISGDLVVDDRYFDDRRYPEGWPGGIQRREAYHAPISALMANYAARRVDNRWRAVEDPALHLGERLRELLALAGVRLEGRVRRPTAGEQTAVPPPEAVPAGDDGLHIPGQLTLIHTIRSEPLGRLVLDLNKFSNNPAAECVVKTLGAQDYGPPGTTTKGLATVARFLNEVLGIPLNAYIQADGSGLSALNRFSPRQLVQLLQYAHRDFHLGPEFVSSFKLGGLDGWNPRPFRDPPLVGELRVKSGHIRGVNTLAGYAHTQGGKTLAFCLMVNGHRAPQWEVDQRIAEISRFLLTSY